MAFNDYVQSYIGGLSGTLGWDANTINFVVSDALEVYGVATEAEATDLNKAHALLKYKAMERAMVDVSADINYSADGESFQRSNAFTQFKTMFKMALQFALPYLPSSEIQIGSMDFGRNPYSRSTLGQGNADMTPVNDQVARDLGMSK